MTYQDAVDLVSEWKKAGKNPKEIVELLVNTSYERGSLDNITAIVVFLNQ
jgi:serine/threonine protein phosphatase PrpC